MEPEARRRVLCEHAYAMKKHHATRLHYDLRLEWNGVLLSWALPEGPSCCAGTIRKAIEMEDHSRANLLFEGVHETGPIMLWDRGTWEPQLESDDIRSALSRGVLQFTLRGEKLKGGWTLARINGTGNAHGLFGPFASKPIRLPKAARTSASWKNGRTVSAQERL